MPKGQFTWESPDKEEKPFIHLCRPCECGCDERDGYKGVGYIIFGERGEGATIWIESEEVFLRLWNVISKL